MMGFLALFALLWQFSCRGSIRKFMSITVIVGVLFLSNFFFWFPLLEQSSMLIVGRILCAQFLSVFASAAAGAFLAGCVGGLVRVIKRDRLGPPIKE